MSDGTQTTIGTSVTSESIAPTTVAVLEDDAESSPEFEAAMREGMFVGLVSAELDEIGEDWTDDDYLEFGLAACEAVSYEGSDLIASIGLTSAAISDASSFSNLAARSGEAAQIVLIAATAAMCDDEVKDMAKAGLETLASYELEEVRYLVALHARRERAFFTPADDLLLGQGRTACEALAGLDVDQIAALLSDAVSNDDALRFVVTVTAAADKSLCPEHADDVVVALESFT